MAPNAWFSFPDIDARRDQSLHVIEFLSAISKFGSKFTVPESSDLRPELKNQVNPDSRHANLKAVGPWW